MYDPTGPYSDEQAALQAAYDIDDEGLTCRQYFDKHASDGLKRYTEERIREYHEAWERGEAIG